VVSEAQETEAMERTEDTNVRAWTSARAAAALAVPALIAASFASADAGASTAEVAEPAARPALRGQAADRRSREEAAYAVTTATLPPGVRLEVGGLELVDAPAGVDADGPRVLACTRRGEVWAIDGFAGAEPDDAPTFTLVAEGLHEPLGLLLDGDGTVLSACRSEVVRLRDADGDGRYERQEVVAQGWDISGNYHEYNFGPTRAVDGSLWITTNKPFGDQPFGRVDWRGYAFRLEADGSFKPMAAGLRSPAGVNTAPWGEVFYTDNQGEWCGANKLSLLVPGSYHGHPHGIASTRRREWTFPLPKALPEGETYADVAASGEHPAFQLPAVWFPYDKMGRSPAGFVWDETGGAFGPFAGQLFVADQFEAAVFRVDLERVAGRWQGACFRFREGLACGALRLAFTPDGALIVGETARGWGSKGPLDEGIQRIDWTGVTPFEVLSMRQQPGGAGFRLRFTQPVDRDAAADTGSYALESYTYAATSRYGSPELDRAAHAVTAARPHEDGLGVDLDVEGLREGYVFELDASGVERASDGAGLLHPDAFYTLVRRAR